MQINGRFDWNLGYFLFNDSSKTLSFDTTPVIWNFPKISIKTLSDFLKTFGIEETWVTFHFDVLYVFGIVTVKLFRYTNILVSSFYVHKTGEITKDILCPPSITIDVSGILSVNIRVSGSIQRTLDCNHVLAKDTLCQQACFCVNGSCKQCLPYFLNSCKEVHEPACMNFLTDYISQLGPNPEIDKLLHEYCAKRYTKNGELDIKSALEDPLCACHLDQSFYNGVFDNLKTKLENIDKVIGKNKIRCLVPQCANSIFPDTSIGKDLCKGVSCVNVIEFDNNGKFDPCKVKINTEGNCVTITNLKCKKTEPIGFKAETEPKGAKLKGPEPKTPKKSFLFLFLTLPVLVLLVIIIVFTILSMNKKRGNK